jgi:hypothetical protein
VPVHTDGSLKKDGPVWTRRLMAAILPPKFPGVLMADATSRPIRCSRLYGDEWYVHAENRPTAQSTDGASAEPMIVQEDDGDHLVHSSGPVSSVPFLIKLDGQFGHTEEVLIFEEGGADVIPHRGY